MINLPSTTPCLFSRLIFALKASPLSHFPVLFALCCIVSHGDDVLVHGWTRMMLLHVHIRLARYTNTYLIMLLSVNLSLLLLFLRCPRLEL